MLVILMVEATENQQCVQTHQMGKQYPSYFFNLQRECNSHVQSAICTNSGIFWGTQATAGAWMISCILYVYLSQTQPRSCFVASLALNQLSAMGKIEIKKLSRSGSPSTICLMKENLNIARLILQPQFQVQVQSLSLSSLILNY